MKVRILPFLVFPLILTGMFAGPSPAGEAAQTVTLYSNGKGDAGWIEVDRASGRMRATPYLRVSGETALRAGETAGRAGKAGVSAAADIHKTNEAGPTERNANGREVLSSLLAGPEGVSFGRVLDLAREASDSAKGAFRPQGRDGNAPPQDQAGPR